MVQPPDYRCTPPLATQTSQARADFGRQVEARLAMIPGVQRMPADNAAIYCKPDFLTAKECKQLVRLIDDGCAPSAEFKTRTYENHRTSSSCNFHAVRPEPAMVSDRIATLLGLPQSHGEAIQGQRYQAGQHFRVHPDFFFVDQPYWQQVAPHGGQRTWTAMIYLNVPEEGGATNFPYAEVQVAPQRGLLLAWNNMKPDGSPNLWTFHECMSVDAGTKYILTKWFRERPWV